ncbi:hypothetical protein CcI49_18345 [Frankia sp. CcI49]|uniref:SDR family NAD(P)-dependent oxidoreductase n=1 Tax=Frankia sp. CcI49 TaxID=1745382 RepID=UPI000977D985|nr:SDR family NAD(P)-dependent oxidoreductase [Frankia sp. CcI49]ONH59191.1 hypothetical protein CcI49_18345 [Frankia sp. CcI49]
MSDSSGSSGSSGSVEKLAFDGGVVIVTGAGGGLGREYAHQLAARGARVVVNDIGRLPAGDDGGHASSAAAVVAEITAAGGEAVADHTDLRAPDGGEHIVATALDTWGRLDGVVNNAGVASGGSFSDLPAPDFDAVLSVNLFGALAVTRAAWPHLGRSGAGRVVNVTSHSIFGAVSASPYIVSRTAHLGLTAALAAEGAEQGIKVNCVMPAAFTRMTADIPDPDLLDLVRTHFPTERVAPLVVLLCHPSFPNSGQVFHAGGGLFARVAIAVGSGHVDPKATPDDLLTHLDSLTSMSDPAVPTDINDVMNRVFTLALS